MELTKKITPEFLSGGGEMGELIRTMDWSQSTLGDPFLWPPSLRTSVSICLNSRFPMVIWWGNDLAKIYNDAYREIIAAKHPQAMGAKEADVWPEIWPVVGPMLRGVLQTGEATWSEEQQLIIERNGYHEEYYFTFSYSAIRDETGNIGGVFCAVNETTKKVLSEKHLAKQFSSLFVQAPVAICILRGENYVIEVINERMAEMWDRKMEAVLNKPAFEVLTELRDQGFNELLDNVYNKGERFVTEEMPINLKRNGKLENAFVKFVYEPLREENGTISGVMAFAHEITEQVLVKQKMEESEAFNRTVLESSPDCLKVIDGEGRLIFMNSNGLCALEIDDFTSIQNKPWWEMWGDDNKTTVKAAVTKALRGEPAYFQAMDFTVKGTPKWWDIIVSPVQEEASKKVSHIIAVSRDITKQKQEAIKLEESEYRYHSMIHSSTSLILILKGEDLVVDVANDAMLKSLGKGKEIIGKPLLTVIPEIIEQGLGDLLHQVYTTGQPNYGYELPVYIMRNGKRELSYYTFVYQAQKNLDGDIEGVAVIANEVSSQAALNLKIKESEERFRSLADQIPMFTYLIEPNEEASISYWNKTWLAYTGQTSEEALGRAWYKIIHPDDVPGIMDIYLPAFQKREPYYLPGIRVKRYDGIYRWHMIKSNPRYLPNGEFMGYIGVGFDIHESKLAVDALKESEERMRNLVEKAPSPICILKGEDMVLVVANDPVFKVWNVGKEALGKAFLEIIPEMKGQPFMGWLLDVFKNGVTHYGNEEPACFSRKNGDKETIYFNFVYQPYREDDGTISGVMVLATDVTEQVIARKKMEAQAVMVNNLLLTAPAFICTLAGPDHVYELVNERYQQLFGKRKIQGRAIMEALPELEGQGFDKLLDKVYNTGETYVGIDIPITLARDENLEPEVRYFNFSYQPMYDENKEIYSILVFGYEVTEKAIFNKKINDSEAHFRLMADLMPAKITNADPEGNVIYYNKNWMEYSGLSFEEFKNLGYQNMMHPDELEEFQKRFQKAAETKTDLEMEMRFKNAAGDFKWHLNLASPVKDENGNIKMWVGVTTEIQKIKDEELRKDNFIKMVSHELKTPVTSIKGYVQLLLSMIKDEQEALLAPIPIKPFLIRIDKLILRLSTLITELLDLSRIEAGKLELKKELFNLNELIIEAVEDIRFTNPKHTIKICQDFNCNIYGDKGRIAQVAINLITNAIKYSANNYSIELRIYKAENNHVAVSIQDYGIGIDKKDHEKIFERFYRVGGKSEDTYPGFGIGLFIVKEILLQHNGFITIESEKGKGSLFTFTLPFIEENKI